MNPSTSRKRNLNITVSMPNDIAQGIGRIVGTFSILEDKLRSLLYSAAGLDQTLGNLLVRNPRAQEMFDLAVEVLNLQGLKFEDGARDEIARMRTNIESVQSVRDWISHSPLCQDQDTGMYYFVRTRGGSWKPDPKGPKVRREIEPSGIPFDFQACANVIAHIEGLCAAVDVLGNQLNDLIASQARQGKPT
jgi:hypothetical protein